MRNLLMKITIELEPEELGMTLASLCKESYHNMRGAEERIATILLAKNKPEYEINNADDLSKGKVH